MEVKTFLLIVLIEGLVVSVFAIFGLAVYAQRLKQLLKKARETTRQAKEQARTLESELAGAERAQGDPQLDDASSLGAADNSLNAEGNSLSQTMLNTGMPADDSRLQTYTDYIDSQLEQLLSHHSALEDAGDIALDIDPSAPLSRRVAAVRHGFLIAEREGTINDTVNWNAIEMRYKQLLHYFEEFVPVEVGQRMAEQQTRLEEAAHQIESLESYRQLYFDLEQVWQQSQQEVEGYYEQLLALMNIDDAESEEAENVMSPEDQQAAQGLLERYHSAYQPVITLFEQQQPLPMDVEAAKREIEALRSMNEEQSLTIVKLKRQIAEAQSDNDKVSLIRDLELQLERQERFMKESESCVTLMEDELSVAYKELQTLRSQVKQLPGLKAELKELIEDQAVAGMMIEKLKQELDAQPPVAASIEATAQASGKSVAP